jgi:N-acetylmuramoyl-L-alanine amidase
MLVSIAWLQFYPARWTPEKAAIVEPEAGTISLVILDPGHGGMDSGAIAGGMIEKDLTLDVTKRIQRLVRAKGLPVLLTRDDDRYISLSKRAAIANREEHCVFVSVHFNEGQRAGATGVETYYASHVTRVVPTFVAWLPFFRHPAEKSSDAESADLAKCVQEALISRTQASNRGMKTEQFFVIANVRHPAVLVEGGFLTNKEDAGKLASAEYREQLATAIGDGIIRYRETRKTRGPALAASEVDR